MPYPDMLRYRLRTQHVAGAPLATPDAVVHWLGAVQSQDYAAARWAVGQRIGDRGQRRQRQPRKSIAPSTAASFFART